ncbi:MAG: hypothetical protein AB1423_14470 [Pseudomonadota bacterium]
MGTESYTIGRGKLLFQPDGYADSGFEDLGNCPDFKITVGTDKKEHISSREGLQTKDLEVVIKQTATGQFSLDEPKIENIKRFIMSDAGSSSVQSAGNDASAQDFVADLDRWIDLGKKNLTTVVVKDSTETTTYVEGTDYTLDKDAGLLKALSTGSITDDEALKITRTWGAATITQANAAKATTVKGHVWFVGNPATGRKLEVKGYVSLLPNGDISLISDDWMLFGFSMEFLTHASYAGLFEVIDRGYVT